MATEVSKAGNVWLRCVTVEQFKRAGCRLLAPLLVGFVTQALSGCTVLGYAIGNAQVPDVRSYPVESASAIPRGEEVEVLYLPRPTACAHVDATNCEHAPCATAGSELSVATGDYEGVVANQLWLSNQVYANDTASHEAFAPTKPETTVTRRRALAIEQVRVIRTKPSHTPALLGALAGLAADVAFVAFMAPRMRSID